MKRGKIVILASIVIIGAFVAIGCDIQYCSGKLTKFHSYNELKEFLLQKPKPMPTYMGTFDIRGWSFNLLSAQPLGFESSSVDYSKTNVQVEGVDEADTVKTDGEYIYAISGQNVIIVKAYPPEEAEVLSSITVNGMLKQMFVNEERLIVFYKNTSLGNVQTVIGIYDLSDKANPTLKREIAFDGNYFNSRMISDYVYAVITKAAWINSDDEVDLPKIYFENECRVTSATDIYHSDVVDYGYMFTTVVAVNVFEDGQEPISETVLTGWATDMYVSVENIYLAMCDWNRTFLYRIHIENGEISIAADGLVDGTVLNQFSMDEHDGFFRIATTKQSLHNIYVLNMDLDIVGRLEGLAPNELIHSARFMGDIGYLVTFMKIDPLFVIDLSNPYNPKVLGELEVSGYSDYLHPYDENHVIGVGKETILGEGGSFSWYQGVKISLFDVTDVTEPKELAKYEIGDRGTESPVLSDHKAFLFDKEKNLLVIPVLVAEINESQYPNGVPPNTYGTFVWQGAYVFTVSLELAEKILLKGTITHIENGNVYNASCYIKRALYINDMLYTISDSKIKVNALSDLHEIKTVNLKE